jgi:TolB-like protein/class 3 adenylate cyclase/Tfp pilus assembly protein PilF
MAAEVKKEIALEIAHVLFIDIVAYSKMATDDQRAAIEKLNQIVQSTDEFRKAESENRLLKIATGDGMALIFYGSPEDPVECALEISRAIKEQYSNLRLRMGVNSGPVSGVVDVNDRANVAGAGINMAQRVMDCGDAGHILLSKRVADDLEQFKYWRPHLYHLGECEVKHGEKIDITNLFTAELGNRELPERFKQRGVDAAHRQSGSDREFGSDQAAARVPFKPGIASWALVGLAITALALGAFLFWHREKTKASAAPSTIIEKSVAVLPFENLSEEKANAFFADGVQDQILTALAKIADLKVISRTSVMQYKSGVARNLRDIGQQLGVAHLLEGSVQRAGNTVRVNAQLINATSDAHEWAENYDRPVDDLFAIQSEIAKAIADQLQAKLSPKEKNAIAERPTSDVAAFDLYSRAKTLLLTTSFSALAKPNLLQAIDLLNQALARDPAFFLAQCQLAYAHDNVYHLGIDHTPARLAQAEAAAQAAFRLRPDAGEAHLARAEHLYRGYLDYDKALAELELARRTLPNDPRVFELTGYIARRQGKQEEALRSLERAVELDPRNFFTLQQIALSYVNMRRYSDETAVLDRALSIIPDDVETKVVRALVDFDWKANPRPLHETIAAIQAKDPAALQRIADTWFLCALAERDVAAADAALVALGDNGWGNDAMLFSPSYNQGIVSRLAKNEKKARAAFVAAREQQEKIVQTQSDFGPAVCMLGVIDAALGRKEEALREGRRAVELLPVTKDAINGVHMIEYLAMIAAWVGDKDLACEQLAIAVKLPGTLSYGQLKLLSYWDPLRGDPRFEKIVASFAPKE